MAAMAKECINTALEKLNILRHSQRKLILKKEQEIAIENLLLGNDVLAVLPTGFGKSMIFTVFLLAKQEIERRNMNLRVNISTSCILVITPLTSITSDQIAEMESLGLKALELSDKTVNEIIQSRPQFIYCSAENATSTSFLEALQSELHEAVAAIVVDESHTVETWTGKR
jgi:ATP-dependent DNA helicase RecQ